MMSAATVLLALVLATASGEFLEEMVVKPLNGGRVYSHFQFTNRFPLLDDVATREMSHHPNRTACD
jgi:hypothetical protein